MNLAIIPARFGSKALPKKNTSTINGKPMIQYSIEAALYSKHFDEIIVFTDDNEVKKISNELGVTDIFEREGSLAEDNSRMVDVVIDVLTKYQNKNKQLPETFVLLQPTSPLRTSNDIDNSYTLLKKNRSKSLISVSKMSEHPYECLIDNGDTWNFLETPNTKLFRRQDFNDNYYFINGAIYMLNTSFFLKNKSFLIDGESILYKMPRHRSIDVDDHLDFEIVKCIQKII